MEPQLPMERTYKTTREYDARPGRLRASDTDRVLSYILPVYCSTVLEFCHNGKIRCGQRVGQEQF